MPKKNRINLGGLERTLKRIGEQYIDPIGNDFGQLQRAIEMSMFIGDNKRDDIELRCDTFSIQMRPRGPIADKMKRQLLGDASCVCEELLENMSKAKEKLEKIKETLLKASYEDKKVCTTKTTS